MNKETLGYSSLFLIVSLALALLGLSVLLFNKFKPETLTVHVSSYKAPVSKKHRDPLPVNQRHLSQKLFLLHQLASKQFMDVIDIRKTLRQILNLNMVGRTTRMPLHSESFDWISSLERAQTMAVIRMLANMSVADWQDEVQALRRLPLHEQKRAILIGRHLNNACFSDDCLYE